MNPKLSIVFLNYNRIDETRKTVQHLADIIGSRKDIEIIAVDNASTDGTLSYLQTCAGIKVVAMQYNAGIGGLNQGFQHARGEYIFVLDDDSHPYNAETLNLCIAHLDDNPNIGIIACRIELANGAEFRTWHLPKTNISGQSMAFVGCGFAIRRSLFEQIGWYPANFFLYQNEIEVAIRVMQKGYQIYYEPRCRVIHRESPAGRGSWRKIYFPTRNTIWIIRRYFRFPASSYMILSRLCMGLIRTLQYREFKWYIKAVMDAFSEPIEPVALSEPLHRQLLVFRRQNSLLHQIVGNSQ